MFGFRKLDVYRCALEALPMAYQLALLADPDLKRQLRRAAVSVNLNIAEGSGRRDDDQRHFYRIAKGSALECAGVLDALIALKLASTDDVAALDSLLVRIVSMLTRLAE